MDRPLDRRLSPPLPWLAGLVGLILVLVPGGAAPPAARAEPARASEPTAATVAGDEGGDPFGRELVDVALLPAGGSDRAPRLLTLRADTQIAGRTHVEVLERGLGRWRIRAAVVDEPPMLGVGATPWLVALDERQFVLVTVVPELAQTWLRHVAWTGDELRLGPRAAVTLLVDDGGAADVDGDGTRELVLADTTIRRNGPTCQGSRLIVVNPATMTARAELDVPSLSFASGAVAALDDVPGEELLATGFRNCPAAPASAVRFAFAVVRLGDAEVLVEGGVDPADPVAAWSGRPVAADVDGDGRVEGLVGGQRGLLVLDQMGGGWTGTELPELRGVLLAATADTAVAGAPVVAVGRETGLTVATLARGGDAWTASTVGAITPEGAGEARAQAAVREVRNGALRLHGGAAWLDRRPDCTALVVPLAVIGCPSERFETPPPVQHGPPWFATRPLARFGAEGGDRLLVAATASFPVAPAHLAGPAPLAAEPPEARWRHGPSMPFRLGDVPASLLGARADPPRIAPAAVGAEPSVLVGGSRGDRVVVEVGRGAAAPEGGVEPVAMLSRAVQGRTTVHIGFLEPGEDREATAAARATSASAAIERFADARLRLPLPPVEDTPDGEVRWAAVAFTIGPLGEVSPAARRGIAVDRSPPQLVLDPPLIVPPWPFSASLVGRAEPGSAVLLGEAPVDVAADGRFAVVAQLPPWPQRLDLSAVDLAGNATRLRVDVVGGLDYRQLPWPALLLVALVVAALLGARRGTHPAGATATAGEGPELEELTPPVGRGESGTASRTRDRGGGAGPLR